MATSTRTDTRPRARPLKTIRSLTFTPESLKTASKLQASQLIGLDPAAAGHLHGEIAQFSRELTRNAQALLGRGPYEAQLLVPMLSASQFLREYSAHQWDGGQASVTHAAIRLAAGENPDQVITELAAELIKRTTNTSLEVVSQATLLFWSLGPRHQASVRFYALIEELMRQHSDWRGMSASVTQQLKQGLLGAQLHLWERGKPRAGRELILNGATGGHRERPARWLDRDDRQMEQCLKQAYHAPTRLPAQPNFAEIDQALEQALSHTTAAQLRLQDLRAATQSAWQGLDRGERTVGQAERFERPLIVQCAVRAARLTLLLERGLLNLDANPGSARLRELRRRVRQAEENWRRSANSAADQASAPHLAALIATLGN